MMSDSLQFVDFYADGEEFSALMHCEPLALRSRLHDWKIQPHRHKNIDQVFLLTEGGGTAYLDGTRMEIAAPCVLLIPGNLIHAFDWQPGSEGYVVSVASNMLRQLSVGPAAWDADEKAQLCEVPAALSLQLAQLCQNLAAEQAQHPRLSEAMQKSLLEQLFIWIIRLTPASEKGHREPSKPERKLLKFKQLIQIHATQQHQVEWYAREIGVSSTHLNQICRALEQSNALGMIHRQLLNEAKRYLIFADLSVASISDRLGFSEPGYFNKFFKRLSGVSPAAFRRRGRG